MSDDELPLSCTMIDGAIVIWVGEKALAHATNINPKLYDPERDCGLYAVTDHAAFAKEVVRKLKQEGEDGSTMLTDVLDRAVYEAINDGAEGVDVAPNAAIQGSRRRPPAAPHVSGEPQDSVLGKKIVAYYDEWSQLMRTGDSKYGEGDWRWLARHLRDIAATFVEHELSPELAARKEAAIAALAAAPNAAGQEQGGDASALPTPPQYG